MFIGYPEGYKGWRIWDGKKVVICETVVFDERYFSHLLSARLQGHSQGHWLQVIPNSLIYHGIGKTVPECLATLGRCSSHLSSK